MPGFNRTGPWGEGPMTGGRRGLCASRDFGANQLGRGRGFGMGRGQGMGRGFGRCNWAPAYYNAPMMNRDQEIDFLKGQAEALKRELEDIESRIGGLEKQGS